MGEEMDRERKREGESWTAKSADDVTEMLLNFALLWVSPTTGCSGSLLILILATFSSSNCDGN